MTNPDTNTLNGALEQLGITMADNLNTMGVSDADPSDGLTTLAGKILEIAPVPPTPTPASLDLSLTAGKQILSYADVSSGTEYATFTATVLDQNDDPLPGVSVSIYKDDVLWYTAETGAGGTISKTYDSEGVGDVSFKAECGSFVTEPYGIEDCIDYQPLTSNAHESRWTIPSEVSSNYTNDGWKATSSPYKQVKLTDKLTSDCSVEFTLSDYSNTQYSGIIIYAYTNGESTPNQAILIGGTTNASDRKVFNTQLSRDLIKGEVYRIEYTSSTLKVYEGDTLLGQASSSVGLPTRFEFHTGANRWAIYKDLKIKPL